MITITALTTLPGVVCLPNGQGNFIIWDDELPTTRPADWHYRSIANVTWNIQLHPSTKATIGYVKHPPLKGVTGAMLNWWMQRVNGTISDFRDGKTYSAYLFWHPR
jgi:hypothetical protein